MKNLNINSLRESYKSWYGEPDKVYNFNLVSDKLNQFELDILVYDPLEDEDLPTTAICTSGLSLVCLSKSKIEYPTELILEFLGRQTDQTCRNIAESLAKFVSKLDSESGCVFPDEIYPHGIVPLNPDLNQFVVIDWGVTSADFLPETDPPVRLLRIVPLYADEADQLQEIPLDLRPPIVSTALSGNWDDPSRKEALFVEMAIEATWRKIERWYEKNATKLLDELNPGVTKSEIEAFEVKVGSTLPKDFIASYMEHNGEVQFHDYKYLTFSQVERNWLRLNQLMSSGELDGFSNDPEKRIQDMWWNSQWVPFAEDSAGNLICIDLDPAMNGVKGQILYWEINSGPISTNCPSFFFWLKTYKDMLYSGKYVADKDGYLTLQR